MTLKFKAGVTIDNMPHELPVAGDKALAVVAERASEYLGHVTREFKVPKCSFCRCFGHDASACVRSYASVTGPARDDDLREHLMNEADAEETAVEVTDEVVKEPTSLGRAYAEAAG